MFPLDDLKKLDPTKIDLTRLDLPKFELPKFELPKFELPRFERPQVELPLDRLVGIARDAAYVGVGAAVVAVRATEERRRAVTEEVTVRVRKLVDAVA